MPCVSFTRSILRSKFLINSQGDEDSEEYVDGGYYREAVEAVSILEDEAKALPGTRN